MDIAHHRAAEFDCGDNVKQRIFHQHHVGGVHGDVRSRADCNPDVGAHKRGCVVDSVADHRDFVPLFLQRADMRFFFGRQNVGNDRFNPDLFADCLSGRAVVAREHDNGNAHFPKLTDCRTAVITHGIRHGDDAGEFAVAREKKRCFAVF